MLTFVCVLVILIVAYAFMAEGLFTSFTMFVNVLLAGLLAFNFFEPLAAWLEPIIAGTFAPGYEDAVCLGLLFWVLLGLLRLATNNLAYCEIAFPPLVQRIGGALVGLLTGYLLAGFLVCLYQTIPWHEQFMGYSADYKSEESFRRYFPPDRVWLALVQRAGKVPFTTGRKHPFRDKEFDTFDRESTFVLRYLRYRRYGDNRDPLPYYGEFDEQLRSTSD
jgi:hypothetical protein